MNPALPVTSIFLTLCGTPRDSGQRRYAGLARRENVVETAGFPGGSLTTGLLGTVKRIEKLVELGIHMAAPPGSVLLPSASMTVDPDVRGSLSSGELEYKSESLCESGNRGTRGLIRVGLP